MIAQVRREIFELMLRRESCATVEEFLAVITEIENKIDLLVNLSGLGRDRIEALLDQQYIQWLSDLGHGTDEPGANFS